MTDIDILGIMESADDKPLRSGARIFATHLHSRTGKPARTLWIELTPARPDL